MGHDDDPRAGSLDSMYDLARKLIESSAEATQQTGEALRASRDRLAASRRATGARPCWHEHDGGDAGPAEA
jgi:hypothetical protein